MKRRVFVRMAGIGCVSGLCADDVFAETVAGGKKAEALALLKDYQAVPNDAQVRMGKVEAILALGRGFGTSLLGHLGKVWARDRAAYVEAFQSACEGLREESRLRAARMRPHRTVIEALQQGELTKEALREKGWPAMQAMRSLVEVTPKRVWASEENLVKMRERLQMTAREWNHCLEALLADEEPIVWLELEREERERSILASFYERRARSQAAKDVKAGADLDAESLACVLDLNFMRQLMGLPILSLDVKLCASAEGHSQDMVRLRFFAHESPVSGKRTVVDRARLAGTSAKGENISQGEGRGAATNRGWFLSPGHHRNLFSKGYKRVGVGRAGRMWTQVFG